MKQVGLIEGSRRRPVGRWFIVGLWVLMLLFSLVIIALVTRIYLMTPVRQEIGSSDWSGYVVVSDSVNPSPVLRNISASWIVPMVTPSPIDAFSDVWIGIGGLTDDSLIQTGTSQDSVDGAGVYEAWYELLPDYSITITSINVSAGDEITTSISLLDAGTDQWLIQIADITSGQSFSQSFFYLSSRLSAEWIVERPTINNTLAVLANFGSATFADLKVSMDSRSGTAADFPLSRVMMYDRQNIQLVTVSELAVRGSTFTVTYLG